MTAELTVTNMAGISSIVAFWIFSASNLVRRAQGLLHKAANAVLMLSFLSITVAIIVRAIVAARFPIANLYESLLLFSWGILAAYLWLSRAYKLQYTGWLAALTVSCIFLYASWLPANQHEIVPLMPALVSGWRAIHVPPLIVSYALLVLGGLFAVRQLWIDNRRSLAAASVAAIAISISSAALGAFPLVDHFALQLWFWGGTVVCLAWIVCAFAANAAAPLSGEAKAELYDEISQRCITIAFPLLTFGIITGALWANHAWGSYWSFDPKESMSLATWLSYAAYLHIRANHNTRADLTSVLAVLGLLLTLLTYLGFTFLGFGGLHSYGQIAT